MFVNSDSVEGRKSELSNTVKDVCKRLDGAIVEACEVVSSTSTTANTVLADITRATEGMKTSSYASIDTFTTLLDGKGDELLQGLGEHFSALTESLSAQNTLLANIQGSISNSTEVNEEMTTVPTGSTPKKARYEVLPALSYTRPHEVIKSEARVRYEDFESCSTTRSVSNDSFGSASLAENSVDSIDDKDIPIEEDASESTDFAPEGEKNVILPVPVSATSAASTTTESKKRKATSGSGNENANPQLNEQSTKGTKARSLDSTEVQTEKTESAVTAHATTKMSRMPRSKRATASN